MPDTVTMDTAQLDKLISERLDALLPQKLREIEEGRTPSLTIIATKGTLDWAYPPFILASTAAALGWNAAIFFTFYGLQIIHKENNKSLQVAPLANPAMKLGSMGFPNIVGALPGMTAMATMMMKSWMAKEKVPNIPELLEMCQEGGVKLIACQMSMDVMGIKKEQLIDGVETAGAGTFLGYAAEAAITLFV